MNNYVITIGRGYGSGGRTIGKMLADKLGINYYDKEIMRLASKESGINQQFFAMADEKLKQTNIFKVSQNVYRGETFSDVDQISNTELFNYQARVLRELATRESFVIMGRCADFVLKLRVHLINTASRLTWLSDVPEAVRISVDLFLRLPVKC